VPGGREHVGREVLGELHRAGSGVEQEIARCREMIPNAQMAAMDVVGRDGAEILEQLGVLELLLSRAPPDIVVETLQARGRRMQPSFTGLRP
jgi:hypothetical protein